MLIAKVSLAHSSGWCRGRVFANVMTDVGHSPVSAMSSYNQAILPARIVNQSNGSTTLVVFVHLRKSAGTAIRLVFERQRTWLLLPYCLSRSAAVKRALQASAKASFLFMELHCNNPLPNVGRAINQTRAQLLAFGRHPLKVISFVVLRNPVDLTLSEHKYFGLSRHSHTAWVHAHGEAFLHSHSYLHLPRSRPARSVSSHGNISDLEAALCDTHVREAMRSLADLDFVGFVESPASLRRIAALATLPDRVAVDGRAAMVWAADVLSTRIPPPRADEVPPIPRKNAVCRYCHGDGGEGRREPRVLKPLAPTTLLRWGNETVSVAALRALAARSNRCSLRVYSLLRERWGAR